MQKLVLMSILIYLSLPLRMQAQTQVEKGYELMEILKIMELYKNAPNLSFTIDYTYADSSNPSLQLEHGIAYSKASDGRSYTFSDSIEFVQSYQYSLAVFHSDSAIVVNYRQEHDDFAGNTVPVMDSLFQTQFVDSMKIYASDDTSTNELFIYLSSDAPYSGYKLTYDRNNYRVSSIQYYVKNVTAEGGATTGLIKFLFTDYSTDPVSQDVFQEDKFIYKQSGVLYVRPAYSGYQLLDNTSVKPTQPILPQ